MTNPRRIHRNRSTEDGGENMVEPQDGGRVEVSTRATAAIHTQRRDAVKFAMASVGLEGLKPSKAAERQAAQFILGEITLTEFIEPSR